MGQHLVYHVGGGEFPLIADWAGTNPERYTDQLWTTRCEPLIKAIKAAKRPYGPRGRVTFLHDMLSGREASDWISFESYSPLNEFQRNAVKKLNRKIQTGIGNLGLIANYMGMLFEKAYGDNPVAHPPRIPDPDNANDQRRIATQQWRAMNVEAGFQAFILDHMSATDSPWTIAQGGDNFAGFLKWNRWCLLEKPGFFLATEALVMLRGSLLPDPAQHHIPQLILFETCRDWMKWSAEGVAEEVWLRSWAYGPNAQTWVMLWVDWTDPMPTLKQVLDMKRHLRCEFLSSHPKFDALVIEANLTPVEYIDPPAPPANAPRRTMVFAPEPPTPAPTKPTSNKKKANG